MHWNVIVKWGWTIQRLEKVLTRFSERLLTVYILLDETRRWEERGRVSCHFRPWTILQQLLVRAEAGWGKLFTRSSRVRVGDFCLDQFGCDGALQEFRGHMALRREPEIAPCVVICAVPRWTLSQRGFRFALEFFLLLLSTLLSLLFLTHRL